MEKDLWLRLHRVSSDAVMSEENKAENTNQPISAMDSPTREDGVQTGEGRVSFKSNIDDILFSDESPSSPSSAGGAGDVAIDGFKSTSSLVNRILNEDESQSESMSITGESPGTPSRRVRSVQFALDAPSVASNLDDATEEQLLKRIAKMQDIITQTQIDWSGEKALRKRKDKNLVKLAKELQKRATDLEVKDKQIAKVSLHHDFHVHDAKSSQLYTCHFQMTSMVNNISDQYKLADTNLTRSEGKYRAAMMEVEARFANVQMQHRSTCNDLEQRYRTACAEHEAKLSKVQKENEAARAELETTHRAMINETEAKLARLQSQHETVRSQLRLEILQAGLDADQLRSKMTAPDRGDHCPLSKELISEEMPSNERALKKGPGLLVLIVVAILLCLLTAPIVFAAAIRFDQLRHFPFLAAYLPLDLLTMNSICAPVKPGTLLIARMPPFETPWWASDELKSYASRICEDRPRVRLVFARGKLTAYVLEGDVATELWKQSAKQVHVTSEAIFLQNKKGRVLKKITAPWWKNVPINLIQA